LLGRPRCWRAKRQQEVNWAGHQLGREGWEVLLRLCMAALQEEIGAFDVPQHAQRLQERSLVRPPTLGAPTDPVGLSRQLCLSCEWCTKEGEGDDAYEGAAQHGAVLQHVQWEHKPEG